MHPIEYLRRVARDGGSDPTGLAVEAADGLSALSGDPRAVLTSCRRLLEFHPDCGPMWWTAAHILGSDSAGIGARKAIELLCSDQTTDELNAAVPSGAVVATTLGTVIADGVSDRPDVELHVVGEQSTTRSVERRLRSANGPELIRFLPDEVPEALDGASLVLVEVLAGATAGVLVSALAGELARKARAAGVTCWAVAGVGRLLPDALFEALVTRVFPPSSRIDDEQPIEDDGHGAHALTAGAPVLLGGAELDLVVTSTRCGSLTSVLATTRCPTPRELLVQAHLG